MASNNYKQIKIAGFEKKIIILTFNILINVIL